MSFLQAIKGENHTGRPPVWLMRQAGRYLPEYRALREKHSFLTLCHLPELATRVTLLPIERFSFDAAILFSDILVIPEAYGMGLHFDEAKGPVFEKPLKSESEIFNLPSFDVWEKLNFVSEAIQTIKREYQGPLIGFSGAPFTLASYMIEGGSSHDFSKTKKWMLQNPVSFHKLLKKLTEDVIHYLEMQIQSGVDVVQIFDSWANILSDRHLRQVVFPYLKEIVDRIKSVPVILFCRGSSFFAKDLAKLCPSAISLDWQCDLCRIRESIPKTIALQGNLDPHVLFARPSVVREEVGSLLSSMKGDPGYIFNLGHGILPKTPLESVYALVETVKGYA